MKKVKVLILTAKTGGGHAAVATAISQALKKLYGIHVEVKVVDGLKEYAPFPIKHADVIYQWHLKFKNAGYGTSWKATNRVRIIKEFVNQIYPMIKNSAYKIVRKKVDIIVSTHPAFVYPCLRARNELGRKVKFISIITDLVVSHASWCTIPSDLVLVSTGQARDEALKHGIPKQNLKITGLPIRLDFATSKFSKSDALKFLNMHPNLPTILLIGGGEGVGQIEEIARELNNKNLKIQLTIIAGRNKSLRENLEDLDWRIPVKIFGFIDFLPQIMHASDILITKAGPTTIAEGAICGLPMIIYDFIPVQETKNVEYVVNNGAGIYEKDPKKIKRVLEKWLRDKKLLKKIAKSSKKLAQPDAAFKVAKIIYKEAQTH